MHFNYTYSDVTHALPRLLLQLDHNGDEVGSRAGRTKELTHVGITLSEPRNREILLEHRKPNIAAQIAETMWVIGGRNDLEFLERYLPRAKDFSDDGKTWRAGYGARLRSWGPTAVGIDNGKEIYVDQLRYVYDTLKADPGSRQAVASIWDPEVDTQPGKDIPCNDWLHFLSRDGYLDLHVAVRSNDVIWGWSGINQFEWSALLEIMAGLLGMRCGALHFSVSSFHIYEHHWAKSQKIREGTERAVAPEMPSRSPRFDVPRDTSWEDFDDLARQWFEAEELIRTQSNLATQAVETFPEPMLQSWLRVLQWWWNSGDRVYLEPLKGTRLEAATFYSVRPPERQHWSVLAEEQTEKETHSRFIDELCTLHNKKHEAYGDSWKRRGEMLGIMANIARKIDRLGGKDTPDETAADTAGDLLVYLAKYRVWLDDQRVFQGEPAPVAGTSSDNPEFANQILIRLDSTVTPGESISSNLLEQSLTARFEGLEQHVTDKNHLAKVDCVEVMLQEAYLLARKRWEQHQNHLAQRDTALMGLEYRGADVD